MPRLRGAHAVDATPDYPGEGARVELAAGSGVLTVELPFAVLTQRFLSLCEDYGSERLAVRVVVAGRSARVPGLPESDDWQSWDADEMRAAIEYLLEKRVR